MSYLFYGVQTRLEYNPRGWLTASTVLLDDVPQTTRYGYAKGSDYLGQGLVEQVTLPTGESVTYEYDIARRLVAHSNDKGERIAYTLDSQGNRIAETVYDAQGNVARTHKRVFDELSRVLKDIGAHGATMAYTYDGAGRLASQEDAMNNSSSYAYDALNRLIATNDASGTVAQTFDAQDRLTTVTDQRGLTTEYRYNGFGDKIAQISPDTGTTTFAYDQAGNLIEKVDARGEITQFAYDVLSRVTDVIYPAANDDNIHYVYDAYKNSDAANDDSIIGRLAEVHDASGHTDYPYNQRGQVTVQDYSIGDSQYQVAYNYNAAGMLESMVYPGGRVVNYDTQGSSQLAKVSTQYQGQLHTLAENFYQDAFGPVAGFTYGNGSELAIKRDRDYRITDIRVIESAANDLIYDVGFVYDLANNIKGIDDAVAPSNSQRFEYDNNYRLIQAKGQYGEINYAYDGVGNRLSRELVNSASDVQRTLESYEYAQDSNRLLSVVSVGNDGVSQHRDLAYDAVGNIVTDGKVEQEKQLHYGARNRLEKVVIGADGKEAHYKYNAKGQRVSKTVDGVTTHFHYDIANQLIAETQAESQDAGREFIYAAGQRVAMVDYSQSESQQLLFVVNDHLGTPQLLMSMAEEVVWQMNASPFGEVALADSGVVQPLRFPGQYADSETGYSYNYFRDYDPSLGRYIQSDPIGLLGGVNTFGYVSGRPLVYVDPWGLHHNTPESAKTTARQLVRTMANQDRYPQASLIYYEAKGGLRGSWVDRVHPNSYGDNYWEHSAPSSLTTSSDSRYGYYVPGSFDPKDPKALGENLHSAVIAFPENSIGNKDAHAHAQKMANDLGVSVEWDNVGDGRGVCNPQ